MQRRTLLKGLSALALADQTGGLSTAWANGTKPGGQGLFRITGEVRVNGQPAREGMAIKGGDTIVTGPGAEAVYVVGQDAFLQRGNSTVSLVGEALKGGLRVLSGKLLAVFGKGDKRIETATATIGIRGTGCYLEAEAERVYFCLCYGVAEVVPSAAPARKEVIETRYHDHPIYILADGSRSMIPATVMNHSDAELIELEGLVGRQPPFYGGKWKY